MSERCFIILDTETTGLCKRKVAFPTEPASIEDRGSEVCQIGGLIVNEDMAIRRCFCHFCDTVAPNSSTQAFAVHGIDQRAVREYVEGQFLGEVLTSYLPEFFGDDVIFIGYNVEFDLTMIGQTLDNTPGIFTWRVCNTPVLSKRGRWSVDVMRYFRAGRSYRKLASFTSELADSRKALLRSSPKFSAVETNCSELFMAGWEKEHNAFFDAINTFLLWRDRIWKEKLL